MRGRQLTYFVFDHDVLAAKADFCAFPPRTVYDKSKLNEPFNNPSTVDWIISVLTVISERATVLPLVPPYILGFVLFVVFVVWNGGIVLGKLILMSATSDES